MAKHKLHQIQLTSGDNEAQPPFPGGWALAIFEAIETFSSELAIEHELPISRRTHVRLRGGQSIKQTTYEEIEATLIRLVAALFPKVSAIDNFAKKYVREYFRLWKSAAEIAREWIEALGHKPEPSGVLARALVRDFTLRLCYLESCERVLRDQQISDEELALLRHGNPAKLYEGLISKAVRRQEASLEKLAGDFDINEKKLRRLKEGETGPEWWLLCRLSGKSKRLLSGIGFMDVLLRTLKLHDGVKSAELMYIAEIFFSTHHKSLGVRGESGWFAQYTNKGDNLLLHPGLELMWPKLPNALWRAHLLSLQFARMTDLAHAYLQFARIKSDRKLISFFENAEGTSGDNPHQWMRELQRHAHT